MTIRMIVPLLAGSFLIAGLAFLAGCCKNMTSSNFSAPSFTTATPSAAESSTATPPTASQSVRAPAAAVETGRSVSAPAGPMAAHASTAVAADLGAKVYTQRCALCHGPLGKGNGPAAASLNPKPRNHTDGSYMNARTDAQLLAVIRDGKGAMPAWRGVLSEQEIRAVLVHVRSLAVPPYRRSSVLHPSAKFTSRRKRAFR